MAHFARVENGIVSEVIVVANAVLLDKNGIEQEAIGAAFCKNLFNGEWIQTSYNAKFRGKYAERGHIWNGTNFVEPVLTEEVV